MSDDADIIARFARQAGLPDVFCRNAEQHFVPLADWLHTAAPSDRPSNRPLIVGLTGAQGSGKTTLAKLLVELLRQRDRRVPLLSLDDFYLPRQDRAQLAAAVHPLLATRGVPGTHDVGLLAACIDMLATALPATTVEWPLFDKASDDRATDNHSWAGQTDLILLEGWCVGLGPQADDQLMPPINELERIDDSDGRWRQFVNEQLRRGYRDVWQRLDKRCFLQVPDLSAVRRWRWQQEQSLAARSDGQAIMTEESLHRFLQHFERLTCHSLDALPGSADWLLRLDDQHRCVFSAARC